MSSAHLRPPRKHSLKRDYAIPTPLHSPRRGRDPAPRTAQHVPDEPQHLPWKARLRHFTWTWFTMCMATGQLANTLFEVPFRFRGLYTIGVIAMILNLVFFTFNVCMITARFRLHPGTFWGSLTHPTESLFAPAAVISCGTILTNIVQYGVDERGVGFWLEKTMIIMFWIYCGVALCSACGIYLIMWSTQTFTISRMTPVWIFPAYPLLVVAPQAAILAKRVTTPERALSILIGGFTLQGIGFMVSTMVYAAFIYRLMTQKLPEESLRPGMFISVGPSGFTISGVIGMGMVLPHVIPDNFMGVGELAGPITVVAANWFGIWLWGLAIFFFIVSVGANLEAIGSKNWHFAMTWFSFVFPNTGLATGTFAVGLALKAQGIQILGCCFTVLIVMMWLFLIVMTVRAVFLKQILWPQKQEDRDENGWILRREQDSGSYIIPRDAEYGADPNVGQSSSNDLEQGRSHDSDATMQASSQANGHSA